MILYPDRGLFACNVDRLYSQEHLPHRWCWWVQGIGRDRESTRCNLWAQLTATAMDEPLFSISCLLLLVCSYTVLCQACKYWEQLVLVLLLFSIMDCARKRVVNCFWIWAWDIALMTQCSGIEILFCCFLITTEWEWTLHFTFRFYCLPCCHPSLSQIPRLQHCCLW